MSSKALERRKLSPEQRLERFKLKGVTPALPAKDFVTLPVGFIHEGAIIKLAKVRPMTGKDRKECSSAKNQKSSAHMTTALLNQCVTAFASEDGKTVIDKVTPLLIRRMCEPDRSFLALQIRELSYPGQRMMVTASCDNPSCRAKVDFFLDLEEDIEVIMVEDPTWVNDRPGFTHFDEEYGMEVRMHYLNGEDQEKLFQKFGSTPENKINPVELLQESVRAMIVDINGEEVDSEDIELFPADLNSVLEDVVTDNVAGPDLTPKAPCSECGHEVTLQVTIVDFLLRGRQKKG